MFAQLNTELATVKDQLRQQQKLQRMRDDTARELQVERERLAQYAAILEREQADVARLEGLSLTGLFYRVLGSKDEQLDQARQEVLAAQLKHEAHKAIVDGLERELRQYQQHWTALGNLKSQYESILQQKEQMIATTQNQQGALLLQLTETLTDRRADQRELDEAMMAGEAALHSLDEVIESLRSAGNWGTWDMLGGDWIATMAKHSRIDEARDRSYRAQQQLLRFRHELIDVDVDLTGVALVGGFELFSDYFFDGLISDWIVQSRINNSLRQASEVAKTVDVLLQRLQMRRDSVQHEVDQLEAQRRQVIEDA